MGPRSKLAKNFISLSIIQILNYVLPFLTLPYLVRVLGPHNYGLTSFAQALVQYLVILTSYGFTLSVTPQIALVKSNKNKVSKILSSVFAAKLLLALLSALLLLLAIVCIGPIRTHWGLYALSFGYVIADIASPQWLFQGLEDMAFMTLSAITSKSISTILIFGFVHNSGQYVMVPVIMGSSNIFGGICSMFLLMNKYRLRIERVPLSSVWFQFKEGWLIFISQVSVSVYTTSNTVILGFLVSPTVVGYYSAAEKLINAGQGFLNVLSQTIYPHVTQLIRLSTVDGLRFIHKALLAILPITLGISTGILVLSHPIVFILYGQKYAHSASILRVLALLPFLISLSNMFGIQTMLNLNYKKAFTTLVICGGLINIVLTFILVPSYGAIGTATSVLISETFITAGMYTYLLSKGINLITGRVLRHGL